METISSNWNLFTGLVAQHLFMRWLNARGQEAGRGGLAFCSKNKVQQKYTMPLVDSDKKANPLVTLIGTFPNVKEPTSTNKKKLMMRE